jgi:hypothetical protein
MVALDYQPYSNIIFSNGELDPWAAGGVTLTVNKDLPAINISKAAHHLDLRLPNEVDQGTPVEAARNQEIATLEEWIQAYHPKPSPTNSD